MMNFFETRRRMLSSMLNRWAKEPLVIFEMASNMAGKTITMNGAYEDSKLTDNKIVVGGDDYYFLGDEQSLYLEDVTKYRTLTITGRWNKGTAGSNPSYASIGILKSEYYNKFGDYYVDDGDFAVGVETSVKDSYTLKTFTFDISKLEGKQRLYLNCHFAFVGSAYGSTFRIKKMVLE